MNNDTRKIDTVSTACCHEPIVRITAGDEYHDFCWQCGEEEPEIDDNAKEKQELSEIEKFLKAQKSQFDAINSLLK